MNAAVWLERGGLALAVYFAASAAGRLEAGRKRRAALRVPLADAAVLEAVFHPRPAGGDDPALLNRLRDRFAAVNNQASADHFLGLHTELAALPPALTSAQAASLHRALLRALASDDPWLQAAAAPAAADLGLTEAAPRLAALLAAPPLPGADAARLRRVLEDAQAALDEKR